MERCCTGGEPGLLQQVSHFWSMLDDLCEKQPEVYRSFIEKQMKNGEELRKAPELHSSVRADMLEPNKGFLYVNICTWKRVPAAESRDKPLPMCEHMKKNLIQVISSTCAEPQQPQYQLEVKPDINGAPCSLCLTVELPKVCSMSECQLSVSKSDILLEVEEVYHLLLEFPKTINEDTASAIFKKKERKLIVTADIL
uniref:PIH1D1/2/3 CS-like domain-containing protein n=1 Tax=Gouania willdenowi TaxID=441366 RepID=A0A8C5E449_GOUWI